MDTKEIKTAKLYSEIHPLAIECVDRLRQILSPTSLDEKDTFFEDKICLDAGCGGLGRAVSSMKMYGASIVVGIDISFENLKKATELNKKAKKIYFIQASVLELPFKDGVFDFTHCSGVLHHTISPLAGFLELTRCLKIGGLIYLCLYGKGGISSFIISCGRLIAKVVPYKIGKSLLSIMIKNKTFLSNLLDVLYVPILVRYNKNEAKQWFKKDYYEPIFIKGKVANIFDSKLLKLFHPSCSNLSNKKVQRLLHGEGWLIIKSIKRLP